MSGLNLLAEEPTPSGTNLLAEAPKGVNLLGEAPVSARATYDPTEDDTRDMLDPMGSLATKAEGGGPLKPTRVLDQMAIGAAMVPNQLETMFLSHPDNLAADASPEAQQRLQQLKADRKVGGQVIGEIQSGDNPVQKMVGGAAQSLPGSVAMMVPAAAGAPMIPAMVGGLGGNLAIETASDLTHRMDDLGQSSADAWAPAVKHGVVATVLETLPLHGATKYMKGAAPLGKTALKLGVGEGVQEGATQLYDDTSTNLEGLTDLSAGDMAANAGEAAMTGILMAPMMGGVAKAVQMGQAVPMIKAAERAGKEIAYDDGPAQEALTAVFAKAAANALDPVVTPSLVPDLPMDPAQRIEAEALKGQIVNGLDAEPTAKGKAFGALMDQVIGSNQKEGRTWAGDAPLTDEGGVTEFVARGREARYNPDLLPPSQRPITFSNDENVIGLTLAQAGDLPQGSVTAVGGQERFFPSEVYSKVTADLGDWVAKYMPEARIVLNLEQFAPEYQDSAFGLHQLTITPTGLLHVITPRDLPGFKYQGGDQKTSVAMLTALSHEFGHAMKMQTLFQDVIAKTNPMVAARLLDETKGGLVSPEVMGILQEKSPEVAGLVKTWSDLREKTLSGKLTAQEFVDAWAGVRKLGGDNSKSLGQNKSLYTWAKDRLAQSGKSIEGATAKELILASFKDKTSREAENFLDEYLSLDEYMAEQFSRAAYKAGDVEGSRTGGLFANALAKLRQLFRDLKSWKGKNGEKVIAPGTTFQAWLDMQTKRAKDGAKRDAKFKLSPAVKKAKKALVKQLKEGQAKELKLALEDAKEPESPPEQVAVPEDVKNSQIPLQDRLMQMAEELEATGAFYGDKRGEKIALASLKGMIRRGQFEEAKAKIEETLGENVRWDRDRASREVITDETKEATIKPLLKNRERQLLHLAKWGDFLQSHPHGFTKGDALVEVGLMGIPLEDTAFTEPGSSTVSLVWKAPFVTGIENERGIENYAMETVFRDLGGDRFVGDITPAWRVRGVEEMVRLAFEDGRNAVLFPLDMKENLGRYQPEEVTTDNVTWLRVDPLAWAERELKWDRRNVLASTNPEVTLVNFAGMKKEDFRNPAVIAQASDMWKRLGVESPFFKRWGGETKVVDSEGKPLGVWRGTGHMMTYLDTGTRGVMTGLASARKAFWFTDNQLSASWYSDQGKKRVRAAPKDEHSREFSKLHTSIEDLRDLYNELDNSNPDKLKVLMRLTKQENRLQDMKANEELHQPAKPGVQEFYLNMENPLVIDAQMAEYTETQWTKWLDQALAEGRDGVIIKDAFDPLRGNYYAAFSPEQVKLTDNVGTFDPTDELHWDKDSPDQQTVRGVSKLLDKFWTRAKLKGLNTAAVAVDGLIQLQQATWSQPDNVPLNSFSKLNDLASQMKNSLQVDAEELVKEMRHMNPQTVKDVHKVLRAEWKQDALASTLVGVDAQGNVVYGQDMPTDHAARKLVYNWRVVDSARLRAFVKSQGIDPTSEQGKKVVEIYLTMRNIFLLQFKGLEQALQEKATRMYENAPTVLQNELWKIEELMVKFRDQPFLPQGNFGDHIVTILKDLGPRGPGRSRFVPVKRVHFESKETAQMQYVAWQKLAEKDPTIQVKSQELTDKGGIPMQLPNDFLETLGNTGEFTDEQIELMSDVMVKARYDKIEARYNKIASKVDGANDDLVRVFANYTLSNANFIWKMYFRTTMRGAISLGKSAVRSLEKDAKIPAELKLEMVTRERRNIKLMENSLNAMLHPEAEFQQARLWITMAFLAGNIKTAVMNAATQMHTWAAVTSEYGEWRGNKLFAQALKDAVGLFRIDSAIAKASGKEAVRLNELKSVYDRAIREGVLDQSYAYYLAGQSNANGLLGAFHNSWMGNAGHAATELGMLPFKAIEKSNRVSSLFTFYSAERALGTPMGQAYETAVQKTGLLQFNYDQANKPTLLRGKKSILFMFASFSLSMGWIMSGGYERGARVQASESGRSIAGAWHGTTMKLWVLYLILGGLAGLPFAENVLDIAQWVWRKFFGTENLEVELRKVLQDVTGDSEVAMHGLMSNAGGFDLSGSFGLGRLLPGTDMLNKEFRNPQEALGNLGIKFAGPAGGFYSGVMKAIGEFSSGNWGEGFKSIPGATGAMAKAIDAKVSQDEKPGFGVTTPAGVRLTYDKGTGEFRDLTTGELVGMALGGTTSLVSANRDMNYTTMGETIYWQTRRGDLLDKYWRAVRTGDEELREKAIETMDKYNEEIPDMKLRITGKDRAETVKTRRKAAHMAEMFGTSQKKMRGVAGDVRGSFGEGGN